MAPPSALLAARVSSNRQCQSGKCQGRHAASVLVSGRPGSRTSQQRVHSGNTATLHLLQAPLPRLGRGSALPALWAPSTPRPSRAHAPLVSCRHAPRSAVLRAGFMQARSTVCPNSHWVCRLPALTLRLQAPREASAPPLALLPPASGEQAALSAEQPAGLAEGMLYGMEGQLPSPANCTISNCVDTPHSPAALPAPLPRTRTPRSASPAPRTPSRT